MKLDKSHRKKTERDREYIAAYSKYRSQEKAAAACNVSRSTISRACYRAGVELTGLHKPTNNGGGSPIKITDQEIMKDAACMTRREIAEKHGMHLASLDRRLRRLGVKCKREERHRQTAPADDQQKNGRREPRQ